MMKWKIGIILGIVLITITGSLLTLPFLMDENNSNNSYQESFSKLKSNILFSDDFNLENDS